jgi:hypothetical protein
MCNRHEDSLPRTAPAASESVSGLPGQAPRLILCGSYAAIVLGAVTINRRHVLPTLAAPFTRNTTRYGGQPHPHPEPTY